MILGKKKLYAGIGIDETDQKSASQLEGGGLPEVEERIVPIPNGESHMLKVDQFTPNGACIDKTFLPSFWEESDPMRTSKNEILNSSACLGRVLIVTGDHIIRDLLRQK